jgi:hypothetical protein
VVAEIIILKIFKEMKKFIKYIMIACLAIVGVSSCETYSDNYKQDFSPIFPLCGEWKVAITDVAAGTTVNSVIYTYDTADKSATQMWLWINVSKYGTKCKLTCDVKASTFSGSGAANTLLGGTNNVSDGKVVVNGADTPSGYKADSIEMTYYSSLTQKTYKIKGFRRTGWPEDE